MNWITVLAKAKRGAIEVLKRVLKGKKEREAKKSAKRIADALGLPEEEVAELIREDRNR